MLPRAWLAAALAAAAAQSHDVTLVTQATVEKLWLFPELCERWRGPLALTLWVPDVAVVEQAYATATQAAISCADATDGGSVSIHVEVQRSNEAYPVNRLRNIGLRSVNTSHVLVSDADFLPSRGLRDAIRAKAHWLANDKLALVVPAFQRKGGRCKTLESCRERLEPLPTTVPGRFGQLARCLREKDCLVFQGDNSPQSHGTTDSSRWLEGDETVRPIECFRSNRYEPYVVISMAQMPLYDERFVGYGKNKIQHVSHLRRMGYLLCGNQNLRRGFGASSSTPSTRRHTGYMFAVLPRHFLIHVPHPRSGSKKEWLNSYQTHSAVDTLYTKFLKEIDARYGAATRVHLCSQVDGDFRRAKRRWAGA